MARTMTRRIGKLTSNFTCSPGCWPEGNYCYCGDSGTLQSRTVMSGFELPANAGLIAAGAVAAYFLFFRKRRR